MMGFDISYAEQLVREEKSQELIDYCMQYVYNQDPTAMVFMGVVYESGVLSEIRRDYKKALEWYKTAAEKDDGWAYLALGICYVYGRGVCKNYEKAHMYINKAIKKGVSRGHLLLGKCYDNGWGVDVDEHRAFQEYYIAADEGDSDALAECGYCWLFGKLGESKDEERAYDYIKRSADLENAYGTYLLGVCYEDGIVVEKNPGEARWHYEKAAENGSALAMTKIGLSEYDAGSYDAENYKEAFRYFELAAELGEPIAQSMLAACYFDGKGVKRNYKRAFTIYRKLADEGDENAQLMVGICYYRRYGTGKNKKTAFEYFLKAAEQNEPNAQHMLGVCYYCGIGTKADEQKAEVWWKQAAANGDEASKQYIEKYINTDKSSACYKQKRRSRKELEKKLDLTEKELAEEKNRNSALVNENQLYRNEVQFLRDNVCNKLNVLVDTVVDIKDTVVDIKDTVDDISDILHDQQLVNNKLLSELREEIRNMPDKTEEAIEKAAAKKFAEIEEKTKKCIAPNIMESAKQKLAKVFGDEWERLSEDSRCSLATAYLTWDYYNKHPDRNELDCSGVCILATGALEAELKRVFLVAFQQYCKASGIGEKNLPIYLKYVKKNRYIVPNEKFTLGDFDYIIGGKRGDRKFEALEWKYLAECREKFLAAIIKDEHQADRQVLSTLFTEDLYGSGDAKTFVKRCEAIRENYRNHAAHAQKIGYDVAQKCYNDLILFDRAQKQLQDVSNLLIILHRLVDGDKLRQYLNEK